MVAAGAKFAALCYFWFPLCGGQSSDAHGECLDGADWAIIAGPPRLLRRWAGAVTPQTTPHAVGWGQQTSAPLQQPAFLRHFHFIIACVTWGLSLDV